MNIKTDLAREIKEDLGYLPDGVEYEYFDFKQFEITRIRIINENGAYTMKKPIGHYTSIDISQSISTLLSKDRCKIVKKGARELLQLLPEEPGDILIVGLGNRMITADSLGPKVCSDVFVTRHILHHIPESLDKETASICAMAPGVLGITGLESYEVVKGIVEQISPGVIIVVDALAARNTDRLGASIQITNTGISPGAGLNNRREGLNIHTLNVPVIAIGVPTVVYTNTIVRDALEQGLQTEDIELRQKIIRNISSSIDTNLVVTPKDIDDLTDKSAKLIAEILDIALNPHLSRSEIDEIKN